jgi:hypothetical protein
VVDATCYRYRLTVSDNVGNASAPSAASATAKIDTSAPVVTLSAPDAVTGGGAQSFDSGTGTIWFSPSAAGSFTLHATASDAQSGVDHVAFPDLSGVSGWSGTGGSDTSSPYGSQQDYSWSAGATAPGDRSITATNGGGGTASATITVASDSTPPAGQSIDLVGGPWYTTASVGFTYGDGTDAGSGLDSSSRLIERADAPLVNGACGTWSSYSGSYTSPDTTVQGGNCYRYRLTITDKVGNTSTPAVSTVAKVDTTDPAAPNVTLSETSPSSAVSG